MALDRIQVHLGIYPRAVAGLRDNSSQCGWHSHRAIVAGLYAVFRHALPDVARSCLHGVDRNTMAVELTKVALWIEAVDPGLPLDFFDAQIRCGVSIRRRPLPCYIDQRLLGVAFGLRGFGAHFLARRSKLSRIRPISASSGSNFPPYHSSIRSCSSCLGSAMASRKSA